MRGCIIKQDEMKCFCVGEQNFYDIQTTKDIL